MVENITNYIMNRSLSTTLLLLVVGCLHGQEILVDESYNDWTDDMLLIQDTAGDGPSNGIDIGRLWAANDQEYLYLRVQLGKVINMQDDNELTLYIDTDNDLNTGRKINGIGAELEWVFGDRDGTLYDSSGDDVFLQHEDIDLMTSPSVSSSEFEIALKRFAFVDGINLDISGTISIRVEDNGSNGDDLPNSIGGVEYQLGNTTRDFHDYDLSRQFPTDLRVMTLNVLDDNLFDPTLYQAFQRQLSLVDPDIIALQEVRSFTSTQTRDIVRQMLPGTWFHNKSSFGNVVLLSRYPILDDEGMNGNEAHLIDVNGTEIIVINMHLPCCDNNVERQQEVDNMMAYIRDLRSDLNDIKVEANTPIIIMGDSNLVGDRLQQQTLLTGQIQNTATHGPAFAPDWDGTNLEDAKPLATGTPYTKTWYNRSGSFSSGRLDYIIYTGSVLWLQNSFVISTRDMSSADRATYGVNFSDSQLASDHLPTVADFAFTTVATADMPDVDVVLYPNPASELLQIQAKDQAEIEDIKIFDLMGRLHLTQQHNGPIDISAMPAGAYVVRFVVDQELVSKRFTKL